MQLIVTGGRTKALGTGAAINMTSVISSNTSNCSVGYVSTTPTSDGQNHAANDFNMINSNGFRTHLNSTDGKVYNNNEADTHSTFGWTNSREGVAIGSEIGGGSVGSTLDGAGDGMTT